MRSLLQTCTTTVIDRISSSFTSLSSLSRKLRRVLKTFCAFLEKLIGLFADAFAGAQVVPSFNLNIRLGRSFCSQSLHGLEEHLAMLVKTVDRVLRCLHVRARHKLVSFHVPRLTAPHNFFLASAGWRNHRLGTFPTRADPCSPDIYCSVPTVSSARQSYSGKQMILNGMRH